jgi:hypothetical protein
MTQPSITDQQDLRLQLLAAINFGIDFGLPAPKEISFSIEMPHIDLDSAADLCGWADWLGYTDTIPATFGQPASHLDNPLKADRWITNIYFDWRGTRICLNALDPIGWCSGADTCRREYDSDGNPIYPADLAHAPLCDCGCRDLAGQGGAA